MRPGARRLAGRLRLVDARPQELAHSPQNFLAAPGGSAVDSPHGALRLAAYPDFRLEELVRCFNEEINEQAREHWTPGEAVKLMAKPIFLPVADAIESGTYLLYDGACGTSGMLRTRLTADVVTGELDVREVSARLPDEHEGPEPLDATEDDSAEEETTNDLDLVPEEAEA